MKDLTKFPNCLENKFTKSWFAEMQQIIGPGKLKDKDVEQRISEHISRCHLMTDGLPTRSMFFLLDNALLKYLFVSKSASTVLGYSREEITDKGFEWLFTLFSAEELEYKKKVMADLYQFLKTLDRDSVLNCTVKYDLVVERKDGRQVHLLEEMMYPEVNDYGEPLITSCFLHDIGNYAGNEKRQCYVYLGTSGFEEVIYSKSYHINQKHNSPLSRREIQILEQFSNGLTTTQVAQKLYVSENTVKTHRKNILLKLQVLNTAEAIKISLKKNWLS